LNLERRVALLLIVLALVVIGLLPLLAMLGKSVLVDGRFTLAVYERLFADPWQSLVALEHSLVLAGLTAVLATSIGVPLGLLLGKSDLPLRRTLTALLTIPLLLPPYTLAVCWSNLLSGNGWLASIVPQHVAAALSRSLFGFAGCLWVLVSALMPVVMILTQVYVRAVNPRLEEAARLTARWPAVLRYVTLPMILPATLFGAMLVFLLALGEVGVPMFLRYPVFPVETLTQFAAFYDFGAAAAAATPLLVITLLAVALEGAYLREKTYALQTATPGKRVLYAQLGRWRVPASIATGLVALALVVLPLSALIVSSLSPSAYREAITKGADSAGRSLALASLGATLLTAFGFCCGYLIHYRALRLWRAVDTFTLLLFTLPGTVIGIGLIALWNRPFTSFLYASASMIIFAYLAQYTALSSRIVQATLANVPPSREEAAQMTGAPWMARVWYVVIPAALPGVATAWAIAFVFCLRDLGASMLVYPPGQDTLPVRIFTLMANGAPSLVSALCVLLVACTLAPLAVLGLVCRGVRSFR
jgi:iron(III) transport system permease protein